MTEPVLVVPPTHLADEITQGDWTHWTALEEEWRQADEEWERRHELKDTGPPRLLPAGSDNTHSDVNSEQQSRNSGVQS